MSVKSFIRGFSFKKHKSKKSTNSPSAAPWTPTDEIPGNNSNTSLSHSVHTDLDPDSLRSAQPKSTFTSFSTFAAASSQSHQQPSLQTPTRVTQPTASSAAPTSDWIYDDILLEKRGKGLGFTLSGKDGLKGAGEGNVRVVKILPGGVAETDGRLKADDVILSVNGTSFIGLTHREAVDILKAAPATVHLKVKRPRQKLDRRVIDLHRPQGQGLGFMIAGGVDSDEFDGVEGIIITRIPDGGVADRDGRLAVGDRLLTVNDVSMTGMSHEEAVEVLKNAIGVVKLVVTKTNIDPQYFTDGVSVTTSVTAPRSRNGQSSTGSQNGDPAEQHQLKETPESPPAVDGPNVESSSIRREPPTPTRIAPFPSNRPSKSKQIPTSMEDSVSQPLAEIIPSFMSGSDVQSFGGEGRQVTLRKSATGGLGFTVVGGVGGSGIFVSSIVPGGAADLNGRLKKGDQLLSVNGVDLRQVSHREATTILKAVEERALIIAEFRPEEFNRLEREIRKSQKQLKTQKQESDERKHPTSTFFVRALFDYDAAEDDSGPDGRISFSFGDVMSVICADPDDDWWRARRILPPADVNAADDGWIPSRRRVETRFAKRPESPSLEGRFDLESTCSTSGKKRRKSYSLSGKKPVGRSKDRLPVDDEHFPKTDSGRNISTASYEAVVQIKNKMARPIIIFGPLKDKINDDLVAEFPNKFASCVPHTTRPAREDEVDGRDYHFVRSKETMERDIANDLFVEAGAYNDHLYGMSAESIKHTAMQGKHCLLDVSTGAITRLRAAGLYPISVLIKPSSPTQVSLWNQPISEDASRKVHIATVKLFHEYCRHFTAVAVADSPEDVYARTKQIIKDHSKSRIWIASNENLP